MNSRIKVINHLFFLVFLIFIPFVIHASNYASEADEANNYILRNTYVNTYSRYLLDGDASFRIPFEFNNGKLATRNEFVYGGLLNKDEYVLSKNSDGNSYLYDGTSYWTMTKNGSSVFTISYGGEKEIDENNEEYRSRATEFVRPETSVSGSGTMNDPWVFEPMYNITFVTDESRATFKKLNNRDLQDDEKSSVSTYVLGKCNGRECIADIVVDPKSGYQYISNDCNGKYDIESHHLIVSNINRDLTCTVKYGEGFFKISFDQEAIDGGVKPTEFYLQVNESFYKSKNSKDVMRKLNDMPHRTGYAYNGFYYKGIKVIDENGNILESAKYDIKEDTILTTQKTAITYKIKYDLDGGNMVSGSLPESVQYDKTFNINNPAKAGYEFTGWTFTGIDTKTAMSGNSSTNITNKIANQNALSKSTYFKNLSTNNNAQINMKANWSQCAAGTYSDSSKSSCVTCPTGYTSAAGANSINKCYIKVAAGYYLKTANTSTNEECPKGQYSTGGNVFYGSTSSCTNCPSGYTDGTKLENKTAENTCVKSVPAGYRVATAKATENKACADGYYKGTHTVTYGKTSSCTECPEGYRNGTKIENKTEESTCLRNVPAGYRVATAKSTDNKVCADGYYKGAHTVTYGKTSSCTECPSGYRDGTSLDNKKAENTCLKNVPDGNCVSTAKGGTSACAKGFFSTSHTVTYGNTSSCTKCVAGSYQDSNGQSDCRVCGNNKTSSAGTKDSSKCSICSNSTGVSSWKKTSWNKNNTMTNLCTIDSCSKGYYKKDNACHSCSSKFGENCVECTESACTACASGYTLQNGKCSASCSTFGDKCKSCTPEGCTECEDGYALLEGKCVKKSNSSNTISLYDYIGLRYFKVQKVNAGDEGGLPIPTDKVKICYAGEPCSYGGSTPTCWVSKGNNTGSPCTGNGCTRTVCNYDAAEEICSAYGLRMITTTEVRSFNYLGGQMDAYNGFFDYFLAPYDGTRTYGLRLCSMDGSDRFVDECYATYNCKGADKNVCWPALVWVKDGTAQITHLGGHDNNPVSRTTTSIPKTGALSVRCAG